PEKIRSRNLVLATGYFESPNVLGVPGENLPHVSHFYVEPHPYWQQRVVIVGGGNSAVEAALELCRVGARVSIVHFLGEFDRGVMASGFDANKIFIENGREHGGRICGHIKSKPPRVSPEG